MRYGQTLFGGAVAGFVIAAGSALCGAQASGHNEVTRFTESHGKAHAVAAPAESRRVAGNLPVTLKAKATGSGSAFAYRYAAPNAYQSTATAKGKATAFYNAYGFGNATAKWLIQGIRRVRAFPRQARTYAYGEGTPQFWQMGYPAPAVGTAWGLGTTYYVSNGHALASATIKGTPTVYIGAHGHALAPAYAQATCHLKAGFAGHGKAVSNCIVDSAVIRSGIRTQDGGGTAYVTSRAELLTWVITQSQTGYARATAVGFPMWHVGGSGTAKATAFGMGEGLSIATGATGSPGDSSATGFGNASIFSMNSGKATGTSLATAAGKVTDTRTYGKPALAQSMLDATSYKTSLVYGTGKANASVRSITQKKTVITSSHALGLARAENLRNELLVKGAPADAEATATGYVIRTHFVDAVEATGEATATGFNNVNDLVRAPASRTVVVVTGVRRVIVEIEPRQVRI